MQQQNNLTQQSNKPSFKSRRGFASMDKERHKLVSSKGGKATRQPFSNPSQQETANAEQH